MRLTVLVLTLNGQDELRRSLPGLKALADELVIGVDETTSDSSATVARSFTEKVYAAPHAGFMGRGRADDANAIECMFPYCSGDWVLRIDQDETLSPLWSDRDYVARLLNDRFATNYLIPRRWVVPPGDRYISNRHWYPDYQVRLFRNIPSLVQFNRRPHDYPQIAGEARRLVDAWIIHWDYMWHDRATRQRKVDFYRAFSPFAGEEFYLYEDQQGYETRPLSYIYPQSKPRQAGDVGEGFHAEVELLDRPSHMPAGRHEHILVGITNRSNRVLRTRSNFVCEGDAMIGSHWYFAGDPPRVCQWEGEQHTLPQGLAPGESTTAFLRVQVPEEPGEYLLQPDLLEVGGEWLSSRHPAPRYAVSVAAG